MITSVVNVRSDEGGSGFPFLRRMTGKGLTIMFTESKVYLWLLNFWRPDVVRCGKQLRKKAAGYFLERFPDAIVFTAFLPAPAGALRPPASHTFIWFPVPGLHQGARPAGDPGQTPGLRTWRRPSRTPTPRLRVGPSRDR